MHPSETSAPGKQFALTLAAIIVVILCEVVALSQTDGVAAANEKIRQANEKIVRDNEIITRTFQAGNEALRAKNYDEAIKQYDEGIGNDPEHPAVPSLLTNKSVALRARGVARYNAAIGLKSEEAPSLKAAAETDFRDAADAGMKAVQMLKAATASTDADKKRLAANLYYALTARAEAMRIVSTKVDTSQADAALAAYGEYLEVETDDEKKEQGQLNAAKMLLDAGALEKAFAEYKRLVVVYPDNPDVLLGAGRTHATFDADEAQREEAITYFRRFLAVAPATHPARADAEDLIATLQSFKHSAQDGNQGYEGDGTTAPGAKAAPARYEGDGIKSPGAKAAPTTRKSPTKRSRP